MNQKKTKVSILGATFNTGNMGVSMLATGALRCVLARFPQAKIVMLDYAYQGYDFDFAFEGRQIPVRFVNLRFSKKLFLRNNIALLILMAALSKLIPSGALRQRWRNRNPYLREVAESDMVFAVSGGDSFSDIYGLGRFLYVALPQILVLLCGCRLVFLPQTIGPFKSSAVQAAARWIMGRCDAIYSRDHAGLEAARRLLGRGANDTNMRFCYDMAFDVEPIAPAALGIEGLPDFPSPAPVVGINVSGLLLMGGYSRNNMFGLRVEYRQLVDGMIRFFIEERGAKVLLIPHVFGGPEDLESDTGACRTVFEEHRLRYAGRIGWASGKYDHQQIKHIIGLCEFFLGARMHACIGAVSQHIPTVMIAYSDKFRGVMQSIGLEYAVVDPRTAGLEEILGTISRLFDQRDALHSELASRMPRVKQTIREALNPIMIEPEGAQ